MVKPAGRRFFKKRTTTRKLAVAIFGLHVAFHPEFLHSVIVGRILRAPRALANADGREFYAVPPFGNVHLLHYTDAHAQLLPIWFREPSVNLGIGAMQGKPPHLVGRAFLDRFGIRPDSAAKDDQKRTATVREAIEAGSDFIVVGRPIVEAPDPLKAAKEFIRQ